MINYLKRFLLSYIDEIRDFLTTSNIDPKTYQGVPLDRSIKQFLNNKEAVTIYLLSIPILNNPAVIVDDGEYYTLLKEFYIKNTDRNIFARKVLDQYIASYQPSNKSTVSISSKMVIDGVRVGLNNAGESLSVGVIVTGNVDPSRQAEFTEFAQESCLIGMSNFNQSFREKIKGNKK